MKETDQAFERILPEYPVAPITLVQRLDATRRFNSFPQGRRYLEHLTRIVGYTFANSADPRLIEAVVTVIKSYKELLSSPDPSDRKLGSGLYSIFKDIARENLRRKYDIF